jgi:hypothetical protein
MTCDPYSGPASRPEVDPQPPAGPGTSGSPSRPDFAAFGRIGGLTAHARLGAALSAPARQAFRASFEAKVDPEMRLDPAERSWRAGQLLRAHMLQLSQRSVAARRRSRRPLSGSPRPSVSALPPAPARNRSFNFAADRRTPIAAEVAITSEVARRTLAGEPLGELAAELLERDITTPSGRPWTAESLRQLLLSPRTAGLVRRDARVEVAPWPAILPPDVVQALRQRLTSAAFSDHYPFSGLLTCGRCGAALVGRPRDDGARRYVCARVADRERGCGKTFILAEPLEEHLAELVVSRLSRDGGPALAELLDPAVLAETTDPALAIRVLGAFAHRLLSLSEAEACLGPGSSLRAEITALWGSAPVAVLRRVIERLGVRVVINPGQRGSHQFDPSRIRLSGTRGGANGA